MNVAELAGRLLQYTDQRTLAEANTAGQEYLQAAVDAINAAAQLCYLRGPETISVRFFAHNIKAPQSVTVSFNTTWQWQSGGSADHAGQAIEITGDTAKYNRVLTSDANNFTAERDAASTLTTTTATVYNDAIPLDPAITHILPEVVIDQEIPLRAAGTEADLYLETRYRWDYGERFRYPSISAKPPLPGRPNAYWVQSSVANAASGQSQPTNYLRLSPFPDAEYTIRYRAKVRPPKVTVSDLDAANNGAGCTKKIPMPADWDELFILPVARQIYSGSPFFTNQAVKDEFARGYREALELLSETRMQIDRPVRFVPEV